MELQTAIEILEYHQEWRLGKREDMIHEPKKLTEAFDIVLSEVKKNRLGGVSPRIDWVKLRNNFFNECTTETPREESGKKVNMAPHDLFEWFKREISEYVG